MKLIALAVARPVTTAMFYAAVVLLGLIALVQLPRELFPTITFPQLLVVTRYGAAAPEEIENIVTKIIEEQAGTVPSLKRVRSISREGISVVILEFNWGTDMGLAHLAVREKVDLIKDRLPSESDEPIIQRHNPFEQPMMILSVSGDIPLHELTRVSNDVIKKRLQKVDGVASALVSGGQDREILVEADLGKVNASNISLGSVVDALRTSNVNYPAGTTQGSFYEYLVRTIGEYRRVEDIGKTVVAVDAQRESAEFLLRSQGQKRAESFQPRTERLIPLSSLAEIRDTFRDADSYSRHNGRSNISIAVQRQFGANALKTARRVRRAVEELSLSIPKGMQAEVIYDESTFIRGALVDVLVDALTGGLLAFLVLLFFLRNLGDASVVILALPISFLTVFIYLYFAGRSINVIALAGLSLGIGSVVDNAIAVLDNIAEYRGKLSDPREYSVRGASEVAVAQVASMLTNIAVFFPLLFARGVAQQLFKDLFFAAVISNVAALVVALTLLPTLTAYPFKLVRARAKADGPGPEDVMIGVGGKILSAAPPPAPRAPARGPGRLWAWLAEGLTDERFEKLNAFYGSVLERALARRRQVLSWAGALLLAALAIFYFKEKIFMPVVDQGQFLVRTNLPVGTRLEITNRVVGRVESILLKMPEVKDVVARAGSSGGESLDALGAHQGECLVTVSDRARLSTEEAIAALKRNLEGANLEGAEVLYLLQDSSMKSVTGTQAPIAVMVKGYDLAVMRQTSDQIQRALRKIPGLEAVKSSLALPSHETTVKIDKDRASAFELNVSEIARTSLIGVHGFVATTFKEEGQEVPIRVRLSARDRNNPASLQQIGIRSPRGVMVGLGDVATIASGLGPSEIQRVDQQRSLVVSAQVIGRSLGETVEEVDRALAPFRNRKDVSVELGGIKQEIQESFGGLLVAFILAIVLIYMIMAAGFESLLHPFLIMVTVPLGLIGVAFILLVTFTPLSAPVILGVVLLGGIVVNNGIVLIDRINALRKAEGKGLYDAVAIGCMDRLRPVLMTALVTILSLVPVALGFGQGTEISSPMALATLGGLLISTFLTLIVLPVLYTVVEERRERAVGGA